MNGKFAHLVLWSSGPLVLWFSAKRGRAKRKKPEGRSVGSAARVPTFVLQSVIPLMFMLSLPQLDRRKVLLAWPLTHLPDFDYAIGYHRATGHNLFLLLPFVLVGLWAWREGKAPLAQWMLIASIYVGSHLLMDVFAGGVTLLYPLSVYTTCYFAEIKIVTATNTPFLDAGRCSFEGVPTVATVYTWLPASEAALLAFLVPATLATVAWRAWRRRAVV